MVDRKDVEDGVERILVENLGLEVPDRAFDLVESGVLDSLALVDLLARLESDFSVAIPIDDLEFEDLRSVEAISELVLRSSGA